MYLKKVTYHKSKHTYYPYNIIDKLDYPIIELGNITILYGNNGSGKSTLINLLANKLNAQKNSKYLENEMWITEYDSNKLQYVNRSVKPIEEASEIVSIKETDNLYLNVKIITMDDVLKYISDDKEFNHYMVKEADNKQEECREYRKLTWNETLDECGRINYDEMKKWRDASRLSLKKYVDKRVEQRRDIKSNGESALNYYRNNIEYKSIYLLDEPENCLSILYQLKLAQLIEHAAYDRDCQFIIATHSPIFLSLKDATVYNLNNSPVMKENWYELENVKLYYNFFKSHSSLFEQNNDFLNDEQYDYLLMWFKLNDSINEFKRLQNDERLIKKTYEYHRRNKKVNPKTLVDIILVLNNKVNSVY